MNKTVPCSNYIQVTNKIWYRVKYEFGTYRLMRAAKVQASLRIRAVSPEPSLLAHTSSESRGTFRQKARSLAPLNGWACAVKICHDGMLEDTNSLDGAHMKAAQTVHDTPPLCSFLLLCLKLIKIICNYYPTLHLISIIAYIKLGQFLSIHYQDIVQKPNFDQSRTITLSKINETKCAVVFI